MKTYAFGKGGSQPGPGSELNLRGAGLRVRGAGKELSYPSVPVREGDAQQGRRPATTNSLRSLAGAVPVCRVAVLQGRLSEPLLESVPVYLIAPRMHSGICLTPQFLSFRAVTYLLSAPIHPHSNGSSRGTGTVPDTGRRLADTC